MANLRYCHPDDELSYTPSYWVGTEDASFPATRIADLKHPRRTTRTTNTTAPTIECDFGSSKTVAAFYVAKVNYGTLTLKGSDTTHDATPPWSQAATVSGTDDHSGHRQLIVIPGTTFTYQYLQLVCSGLDAGETYYETGAIGAWSTLNTLGENPEFPYDKELSQRVEVIELPGGGEERGRPGALVPKLIFTGRFQRADADYNLLKNLLRIPPNQVVLLDENAGDTTKAYLCWAPKAITLSRGDVKTDSIRGLTFSTIW